MLSARYIFQDVVRASLLTGVRIGVRCSVCLWDCVCLGNKPVRMFVSMCWPAAPPVSRCVHVCLRARRLLNICFAGPWGAQLAGLPALRAGFFDSSSTASRSVNFLRVNS